MFAICKVQSSVHIKWALDVGVRIFLIDEDGKNRKNRFSEQFLSNWQQSKGSCLDNCNLHTLEAI